MASAYAQNMDGLKKVYDDARDLYDVISQDPDVDENDWGKLGRVCERLEHVSSVLMWNWTYAILLFKIEDEKSRFIVNKDWKNTLNKSVIPIIKSLLNLSKQWKFNDYRIVNLQNDIREWSQGMYDFLVEDGLSQNSFIVTDQ